MKTKKISLKEIQGALSRAEMKQIMAGSGGAGCGSENDSCNITSDCCPGYSCQNVSTPHGNFLECKN